MTDLNQLVKDALDKTLTEEHLKPLVEKRIAETIDKVVISQLRDYSDFGNALEEVVKSQLNTNLNHLDLSSYNMVIATAIKTHVQKALNVSLHDEVIANIDKMMGAAPAEISLNELCEKLLNNWWDDNYDIESLRVKFTEESFGGYSLEVSEGEYRSDVLFSLYLSKDGQILINHKMAYNPTCLSDIETFIFKYYAAKTKITHIDEFDAAAECFENPNIGY